LSPGLAAASLQVQLVLDANIRFTSPIMPPALPVAGCVPMTYARELKKFARRYPDVLVVCPEGVDNLRKRDWWMC